MATKLTVQISGMGEFEKNASEVVRLINSEEMQTRLLPGAMLVRDIAKRLVNFGPGDKTHLRDALFATKGKRAKGLVGSLAAMAGFTEDVTVIAGVDRKKAPHAHLVEYGHGGPHAAPAYPYLRPAASAARPGIITVTQNAVRETLKPWSF